MIEYGDTSVVSDFDELIFNSKKPFSKKALKNAIQARKNMELENFFEDPQKFDYKVIDSLEKYKNVVVSRCIDTPLLEALIIIRIKDFFPNIDLEKYFLKRMEISTNSSSTVSNLAVAVIEGNAALEYFNIDFMYKVINDLVHLKNQISKEFDYHISIFIAVLKFRCSVVTKTCTDIEKRFFLAEIASNSLKTLSKSRKYFPGYGLFCKFLDDMVKHTLQSINNSSGTFTQLQTILPEEYRIQAELEEEKKLVVRANPKN